MQLTTAEPAQQAAQDRPTATRSPRRLALGTRLTIYVTLSVAAVITLIIFVGTLIAERQLDNDLRETAEVTAFAVADDIELRPEPVSADALVPVLRSFINAAPDLRSITVFRAVDGRPDAVVSTSVVAPAPAALVQDVITRGDTVASQPTPDTLYVAVPIKPAGVVTGAVAVAVSLGPVRQFQRTAGLVAFGGAAFAVAAIAFLIHLLARRLMLTPLNEIHRVMRRARGGDLGARARVTHDNEMGDVADGLNAMLVELDDLHRSLSQRVSAATGELRDRNQELMRSYQSVSRLRETAARAQQLAAVGQTMANVAHQIGTPLNLVSGHVQLLQQEITDPALEAPPAHRRRTDRSRRRHGAQPPRARAAAGRAPARAYRRGDCPHRRRDARAARERRRRSRPRRRSSPGQRRRRRSAAGAGAAQPRHQRARRDARRRHADARGANGGRARQDRGARHGIRHFARRAAAHVRAVGDDQAGGARHRPRPEHHARPDHRPRRHDRGDDVRRPRHDVHHRAARGRHAGRRRHDDGGPAHANPDRR